MASKPILKRPVGSKGVVIQVKPEGHDALRQLARDLDMSLQKLAVEAFNDLMEKRGRERKIEGAWD